MDSPVNMEPEAQILVEQARREGRLKKHWSWFRRGASTLVGLGVLGWLFSLDTGFLWGLTTLWLVGIAGHSVAYAAWTEAHKEDLARVAMEDQATDASLLTLKVRPANAEWLALWEEAVQRFTAADHALGRLGNSGLVPRDDLHASMRHVKSLIEGQARIETAVRGHRSSPIEDKITEARWELARSEDPRLRKIYSANLDLLVKERETVQSLDKDLKRVRASIQGFILSAQNLHLNATRLGASGETPSGAELLGDTMRTLEQEVKVLRSVEAELEDL